MPDSAPSPSSDVSHESGDERHGQASKSSTVKDKECPYCHQHFTSSSLGRHLDQFIFKKKPDGIHNVDEIRKLRGGITRRTARNSKKDHNDSNSSRPSPAPPHTITTYPHETVTSVGDLNAVPAEGIRARLNSLNWQATGVITDPTVLNAQFANTQYQIYGPSSPSTNLKKRTYTTFANDVNPTALADTARALELSLREVLDSLRAATKHASVPPTPFPFDFLSQTYPSLVLHLLPTPPTLHQASPFSTLTTTPISAPGPDQLSPLRSSITNKIDMWKWQALRLAQRTTSNIADEADFLSRQAESFASSALNHLSTAYENWMTHPHDIRDLLWHVELLRAFQNQKDKVSELEERTDELQQEASQLQQQVEYLSHCQWPREMAQWPPDRHTFSRKMAEEVRLINLQKPVPRSGGTSISKAQADDRFASASGTHTGEDSEKDGIDANIKTENINLRGDKDKWDFDKLVNKWRAHIKEDRQRRTPFIQAMGGSGSVGAGSYAASTIGPAGVGPPGDLSSYPGTSGGIHSAGGGGGGPSGMHWLGERGRLDPSTPAHAQGDLKRPFSRVDGDVNGTGTGESAGSGSPLNANEEGRKLRVPEFRKNISIISDIGGD